MSTKIEVLKKSRAPTNQDTPQNGEKSGPTPDTAPSQKTPALPKSVSNPYHFPERFLVKEGLSYNGVPLHKLAITVDPVTHIERLRKLEMRDDDVIITAFRKCGTHWVSEMLNMLVKGTTDYATQTKEFNMLEFVDDLTNVDRMTSPRLLNSHLYMAHLPEQVAEKTVKLVHLIRNPKDCAVSLYYHMKQIGADEGFTFDNFLRAFITEDYLSFSHQPNFHRQLAQFEKDNPGHPVLHIHYEDLKNMCNSHPRRCRNGDPVPVLQELAQFVGVEATREFCQDVAKACEFDRLKQADEAREMPQHIAGLFHNNSPSFYRKGVAGDWKNTFTVAQSEMFDQFMATQQEKGIPYGFRWQ